MADNQLSAVEQLEVKLAAMVAVAPHLQLRDGKIVKIDRYERKAQLKRMRRGIVEAIGTLKGMDADDHDRRMKTINDMLEDYVRMGGGSESENAQDDIRAAFGKASGMKKFYPAWEQIKNILGRKHLPTLAQIRRGYD